MLASGVSFKLQATAPISARLGMRTGSFFMRRKANENRPSSIAVTIETAWPCLATLVRCGAAIGYGLTRLRHGSTSRTRNSKAISVLSGFVPTVVKAGEGKVKAPTSRKSLILAVSEGVKGKPQTFLIE
jgi:hypothetical protein